MALNQEMVRGLYAHEAANLQRFLTRKLGTVADAQDAVQDAYLRMLTAADVDEEKLRSPKAFLFKVASNIAIDAARRRLREQRSINYMPGPRAVYNGEQYDVVCPQRMPDGRVDDQMRLDRVLGCLKGLPQKCRRAFLMHKFMEMSYSEVAAELGVTVSMVEKYLSQALRHVRTLGVAQSATCP